MCYFLLVQTCENFGALCCKRSKAEIYYETLHNQASGANLKYFVLDANAVKKLFNDQFDNILEWQNGGFKQACPVFLPLDFAERVCKYYHFDADTAE